MTLETNRFVIEVKKTPQKTDAKTRAGHFNEIYADFKPTQASHQASRGAPGAYQFQRNGRPGVRASSYRGQYRHQQGQQQQA